MPASSLALAETVLAAHLVVIAFNIFGLVAIPVGAAWGRRFVRVRWWRWLHLASMAAVAGQALAGRECFLTLLEDQLTGATTRTPLIMGVVDRLIYWPIPPWVFTAVYVALAAYVIALMLLVPADL